MAQGACCKSRERCACAGDIIRQNGMYYKKTEQVRGHLQVAIIRVFYADLNVIKLWGRVYFIFKYNGAGV